MTAARIARRLVRKIVKPAALWLNRRHLVAAEQRADHLMRLRADIVPLVLQERKRTVQLAERRNQIAGW